MLMSKIRIEVSGGVVIGVYEIGKQGEIINTLIEEVDYELVDYDDLKEEARQA